MACVHRDDAVMQQVLALQAVGEDFKRIDELSAKLRASVEALVLPEVRGIGCCVAPVTATTARTSWPGSRTRTPRCARRRTPQTFRSLCAALPPRRIRRQRPLQGSIRRSSTKLVWRPHSGSGAWGG